MSTLEDLNTVTRRQLVASAGVTVTGTASAYVYVKSSIEGTTDIRYRSPIG